MFYVLFFAMCLVLCNIYGYNMCVCHRITVEIVRIHFVIQDTCHLNKYGYYMLLITSYG